MTQIFDKCIKSGKIAPFSPGKNLAGKELRLAKDDLAIAEKSFADINYKWSIVQTYYSMFHSARALLYWNGYREKSHVCLIEAVSTLYVEPGLLSKSFIDYLFEAKNLREAADYYGDFSELNCKTFIERAREFVNEAEKIINKC